MIIITCLTKRTIWGNLRRELPWHICAIITSKHLNQQKTDNVHYAPAASRIKGYSNYIHLRLKHYITPKKCRRLILNKPTLIFDIYIVGCCTTNCYTIIIHNYFTNFFLGFSEFAYSNVFSKYSLFWFPK